MKGNPYYRAYQFFSSEMKLSEAEKDVFSVIYNAAHQTGRRMDPQRAAALSCAVWSLRVGKTIMLYALERYFCRHYADWRDDTREHFRASVTADNLCQLSTDPNNADRIYCYKNCDILFIDGAASKRRSICAMAT